MEVQFAAIGTIRSCFPEKFGIPRQAGLAPDARAVLTLEGAAAAREAVRGLEEFSHLWVVFLFHANAKTTWNPTVRPPRLGGVRRMGVFATRSPHRPNPIGISAVEVERIDLHAAAGVEIHLKGADFLDGTPVLDIKPYVPYADSIPGATSGWMPPETHLEVDFAPPAAAFCEDRVALGYPNLSKLIVQLLRLDPRPAFQRGADRYAARLYDFDVHWVTDGNRSRVEAIYDLAASPATTDTPN